MSEPSPKDSSKSPTFKSLLVDDYERVTDARLQETCSGFGARVCPKVGLKEAGIDHFFREGILSPLIHPSNSASVIPIHA